MRIDAATRNGAYAAAWAINAMGWLALGIAPCGRIAAEPPAVREKVAADSSRDELDKLNLKQIRQHIRDARLAENRPALARALERSAQLMATAIASPVEAFVRPAADALANPDKFPGPVADVQWELDGEWILARGEPGSWHERIREKQSAMREMRLAALKEAGDIYREQKDLARAERNYATALRGFFLYDQPLEKSLEELWPIESEAVERRFDHPFASLYLQLMDRLSSVQQLAGKREAAIDVQFKALLLNFCLEWNYRSALPSRRARELWSLVEQSGKLPTTMFWFHVLDDKRSRVEFDAATMAAKKGLARHYWPELVAAPGREFATLKVTATLSNTPGWITCYTVTGGRHTTLGQIGRQRAIGKDGGELAVTELVEIPGGTDVVSFETVGGNVRVTQLSIAATFRAAKLRTSAK